MPVERRRCGRSELELPILGIGSWAFGGGDYWGPQSQQTVNEIVRHAIEHGCNFFDTAESYNRGASESSLGTALRGIPREQVIIASKISPHHLQPARAAIHCEASLRRLGTEYIDLYMVHWPLTAQSLRHFTDEAVTVPELADAFGDLDRLRREGKIRHIGVSNFGRTQLAEALATGVPIVANELPYNLLSRAAELEILPFCRDRGVGVLGYMALLQGVLSDRYPMLADVPEWRRRTRHFDSRSTPLSRHGTAGCEAATQAAVDAIRRIARQLGFTTSELALKWACAGNGITSSLCGARDLASLRDNIRAASTPLPSDIRAELNRVTQALLDALGPSFDYYENPLNDRTR